METFDFFDFPPNTKFRLDLVRVVVNRIGSTRSHLEENWILYHLTPSWAFLVHRRLSKIGSNGPVETFDLNFLLSPNFKLSTFWNSVDFTVYFGVFTCYRIFLNKIGYIQYVAVNVELSSQLHREAGPLLLWRQKSKVFIGFLVFQRLLQKLAWILSTRCSSVECWWNNFEFFALELADFLISLKTQLKGKKTGI